MLVTITTPQPLRTHYSADGRVIITDSKQLEVAHAFNGHTTHMQMHCVKCNGAYPHHWPGCPEERL